MSKKDKLSKETLILSIIDSACGFYNVKFSDIVGKCRKNEFKEVRHNIMAYLAIKKDSLKITLVEIGKAFGQRDHTTIIHARNKIKDYCGYDNNFKNEFNEFVTHLDVIVYSNLMKPVFIYKDDLNENKEKLIILRNRLAKIKRIEGIIEDQIINIKSDIWAILSTD